jgi:hypothetical protein
VEVHDNWQDARRRIQELESLLLHAREEERSASNTRLAQQLEDIRARNEAELAAIRSHTTVRWNLCWGRIE